MLARLRNYLSAFSVPTIAEVERDYLNASVSHIDLERRERQIADGMFRRSGFDA